MSNESDSPGFGEITDESEIVGKRDALDMAICVKVNEFVASLMRELQREDNNGEISFRTLNDRYVKAMLDIIWLLSYKHGTHTTMFLSIEVDGSLCYHANSREGHEHCNLAATLKTIKSYILELTKMGNKKVTPIIEAMVTELNEEVRNLAPRHESDGKLH